MGSRRNNQKKVIKKKKLPEGDKDNPLVKPGEDINQNGKNQNGKNRHDKNQKKPILQQAQVIEVLDHILQGLKMNCQGLNIGEIKREHKVKIYLLFEELKENPKNSALLDRLGKSDIEIADVIVDYIKAKNKPIDQILSQMSRKEIDDINKLIFLKLFNFNSKK